MRPLYFFVNYSIVVPRFPSVLSDDPIPNFCLDHQFAFFAVVLLDRLLDPFLLFGSKFDLRVIFCHRKSTSFEIY